MPLPGEENLSAVWPKLRAAADGAVRNRLVDTAIASAAWQQQALHEARIAALRLLVHGDKTDEQTKRTVRSWAADYQKG